MRIWVTGPCSLWRVNWSSFFRNSRSWHYRHFCVTSNENKWQILLSLNSPNSVKTFREDSTGSCKSAQIPQRWSPNNTVKRYKTPANHCSASFLSHSPNLFDIQSACSCGFKVFLLDRSPLMISLTCHRIGYCLEYGNFPFCAKNPWHFSHIL